MSAGVAKKYRGWTKASNYLLDVVIPLVTERNLIAGIVLLKLEREIAGFNRATARISMTDFCIYTNKGRAAVRGAINTLEDMGYIEILHKGDGLDTSEYKIILYPAKQKRKSRLKVISNKNRNNRISRRNSRSLPQDPQEAIEVQMELTPDGIPQQHNVGQPQISPENSTSPTNNATPQTSEMPETPEAEYRLEEKDAPVCNRPAVWDATKSPVFLQPLPPSSPRPSPSEKSPVSQPEAVAERTEISREANKIKGADFRPPSYNDLKIYSSPGVPDLDIITNKETSHKLEKNGRDGQAVRFVCSKIQSLGHEITDQNYAFVGWCIQTYGADLVNAKIAIMENQQKRRVAFASPFGWLRVSLSRDFQFSHWDTEVMKAKERSQRIAESMEKTYQEHEAERGEWNSFRDENPDAANNAFEDFLRDTNQTDGLD